MQMRLTAAALLVLGLLGSQLPARTWISSTGKYTVEADFVKLENGTVRLKKADGKIVDVPLTKLSKGDREWVQREVSPDDKPGREKADSHQSGTTRATRSGRRVADEGNVTIPAPLKEQANKTFSEGKRLFVWLSKEGPFKCGGGGTFRILTIPLKFEAKDGKGEKFNVAMAIEIKDKDTGKVQNIQQTVLWHKDNKVTAQGTTEAMYAVVDSYLWGKGTARINLTSGKDAETVISNTIVVDVEF